MQALSGLVGAESKPAHDGFLIEISGNPSDARFSEGKLKAHLGDQIEEISIDQQTS